MQHFVILFRQAVNPQPAVVDPTARAAAMRAWAQHWNAAGHKLDPRILAPESHWFGDNEASGPAPTTAAGPVTALLFLEAEELDQAVTIARTHPAVTAGVTVEVRAWASPAVQA